MQKVLILSVYVLSTYNFERTEEVTNLVENLNVMRSDTSLPVIIYSEFLFQKWPWWCRGNAQLSIGAVSGLNLLVVTTSSPLTEDFMDFHRQTKRIPGNFLEISLDRLIPYPLPLTMTMTTEHKDVLQLCPAMTDIHNSDHLRNKN